MRPRWPLPMRRQQVEHARRQVLRALERLELDALLRVERRQVLEEDLVARLLGRLEVDRLDLDEREVALAVLRRPDDAGHRVAGVQIELADLRRRDVDVVGAGQVVVVGRTQEPEAVGQRLEHALREDQPALLGPRPQDLEDQLLLAHAGRARHLEVLADLGQLGDAHLLQRGEIEHVDVVAALAVTLAALVVRGRRPLVSAGRGRVARPVPARSPPRLGGRPRSRAALSAARWPRCPRPPRSPRSPRCARCPRLRASFDAPSASFRLFAALRSFRFRLACCSRAVC